MIKTKLRLKKKSKKVLISSCSLACTHRPNHSPAPYFWKHRKIIILHFSVHSHCHTCILNITVKNLTEANYINPEKFRFWLTMTKSSFSTDSLKVSHLHILRLCTGRQERTAGSSGRVWLSWMETTQMYPQESSSGCCLAQKGSVNLGIKQPPVNRLSRESGGSQEWICMAAR